MDRKKGLGDKFGKMDLFTKECGKKEWLMEKED